MSRPVALKDKGQPEPRLTQIAAAAALHRRLRQIERARLPAACVTREAEQEKLSPSVDRQ